MKVGEFKQMMAYMTRPAPQTQVADLVDEMEPGPLKDELKDKFDPNQETYEEYLQRKGLGERPFNAANGGSPIVEPPKSMQVDTTTSNPVPEYDIRDFKNDAEIFVLASHNNTLPRADIVDKLNSLAQKGLDAGTFTMQEAADTVKELQFYFQDRAQKQRLRDVVPEGIGTVERDNRAIGGGVIEGEDLGTREGFAEARFDDPSQGVKAGDDLGTGIKQVFKKGYASPKYATSSIGKEKSRQFKTLEEAKKRREILVKEYEEAFTYTGKYDYDELIKDPDFEKYWKDRVDGNEITQVRGAKTQKTINDAITKVIKRYKLKKNDYKGIFEAVRKESQIAESIRKDVKSYKGKKPLFSASVLFNLMETFNKSYKPNVGTLNTAQMEELLKLPKGELSKLMTYIGKPLPDESVRLEKVSDTSRILKASVLKDKLDAAGITYSKFQREPGVKGGRDYRFVLDPDRKKADQKFEILKNSKDFGFPQTPKTPSKKLRNILSGLSKASEEYQKYGYGTDSGTISNLRKALNKHLASLNDKELIKFIKKHPKIENLVTVRFDPESPNIFKNVKLEDMSIKDIRNKANFEIEHIRGFENVKYDQATKKITDGIGVEYPKNLYIINKGLNNSVKKQVENYVANFPEETEKIKKINNYFNKNKITYFNRRTNQYGGYKPTNSAVDLSHFGITKANQLKDLITGTYIDEKGVERVKTSDPNKLIATINEVQESRGMPKLKGGMFDVRGRFALPVAFLLGGGYFGQGLIKEISEGRNPLSMSAVASETGQLPQGSPGQINQEEKSFIEEYPLTTGTAAALSPLATKKGRKIYGALAKPLLKAFGSVTTGGFLSGKELMSEDPNLAIAGADLLLPEVGKRVPGASTGILSNLGRFALNPFQILEGASKYGKLGRAVAMGARIPSLMTPVGLTLIGAEGVKKLYDAEQEEKARVEAMSPEDRESYLQEKQDTEEFMARASAAYGGRMSFADGPDDPSKRNFMKILGGLASLPIFSRLFGVADKAAPLVKEVQDLSTKAPPYFFKLIDKIKQFGEDSTRSLGTGEREKVTTYRTSDADYELYEDLNTGSVQIKIRKGDPDGSTGYKEQELTLTKGQSDESAGVVPDNYDEYTVRPDNDGKLKDVDYGLEDIDDLIEELGPENITVKELKDMGYDVDKLGPVIKQKLGIK